jgi:hypothetical protein
VCNSYTEVQQLDTAKQAGQHVLGLMSACMMRKADAETQDAHDAIASNRGMHETSFFETSELGVVGAVPTLLLGCTAAAGASGGHSILIDPLML